MSRSIDLARTWRCQSHVGNVLYVLTQRKNQKRPQWEAVVNVPNSPSVSPAHLLKRYVAMTAHLVPAGSLLLRQLVPPLFPFGSKYFGEYHQKDFGQVWSCY